MRQLTDSEMAHLAAGWRRYKSYETEPTHIWPFEHGFVAGLDTAAEQVAALEAERDGMATRIIGLRAENERLRSALFKHTKSLKRMARHWREYADGHYCQTYNTGMAEGLHGAANTLEGYIDDAWRPSEPD